MKGIFQLKTAADLRDKLRRDLRKLKENPLDADAAFNFFVTAEHMLDWVWPDHGPDKPNKQRDQERKGSAVLQVVSHVASGAKQVVSHVASGAKHFEVFAKRHDSVVATEENAGIFPPNFLPHFPRGFFGGGELVIELKSHVANSLGTPKAIRVVELAEKVMAYWDGHPLR